MQAIKADYLNQVKLVIEFARLCSSNESTEWLSTTKVDVGCLLEFLASQKLLPQIVFPENHIDATVYSDYVMLQIRASLQRIAQVAAPTIVAWNKEQSNWRERRQRLGMIGIENTISDFLQMRRSVQYWLKRFKREFYFLPRCRPELGYNAANDLIWECFGKWYHSDQSPERRTELFNAELDLMELSIPSSEFNERWPILFSPAFIDRFSLSPIASEGECDLCSQECSVQVKCVTCIDKIICYNCFRKTAWGYQHDDHVVFSHARKIWCPFCKTQMDDASQVTLVGGESSSPKRQKLFVSGEFEDSQ